MMPWVSVEIILLLRGLKMMPVRFSPWKQIFCMTEPSEISLTRIILSFPATASRVKEWSKQAMTLTTNLSSLVLFSQVFLLNYRFPELLLFFKNVIILSCKTTNLLESS
jgi:hypothetical protein